MPRLQAKLVGVALLLAMSACQPKPSESRPQSSPEPSETAPAAEPVNQAESLSAGAYPRLEMWVSNPSADEGEDWYVLLHQDGTFQVSHTYSDGANDTADRCEGLLPKAELETWFAGVVDAATELDPSTPRTWKHDGTDPNRYFNARYQGDAKPGKYVPWPRMSGHLDRWFDRLLGLCH